MGAVGVIAVAHSAVVLVRSAFDLHGHHMFGFYGFFNMGKEANLPTFVSALYLLFAAGLLVLIARRESQRRGRSDWHWWGLAAGFALMSVDEAARIHESIVGRLMQAVVGRDEGVLHYPWYGFYLPLVVALAGIYLPFLLRIPRAYAIRFAVAGFVFLAGSLGVEMLEAYLRSEHAARGWIAWTYLIEETFEMTGVVLFIHALLRYLAESGSSVLLAFRVRPG